MTKGFGSIVGTEPFQLIPTFLRFLTPSPNPTPSSGLADEPDRMVPITILQIPDILQEPLTIPDFMINKHG